MLFIQDYGSPYKDQALVTLTSLFVYSNHSRIVYLSSSNEQKLDKLSPKALV